MTTAPTTPACNDDAQRGSHSLRRMVGASGHTRCWRLKKFGSQKSQDNWIEKHKTKNQIVPLFVNNGYAVEYRSLIKI